VPDLPHDDSWISDNLRGIGDRVRQLRLERNLTQEQLYLAARIRRWTLQRVEAGEDSKTSTLLRIAKVLGVPLAELVG
jgi:transcriptional regulator with XRE-family HTH domain